MSPFQGPPVVQLQELANTSWNPKLHYCVYKRTPTVPTQSHIYPVHTIPVQALEILFNIDYPSSYVFIFLVASLSF
jgi:hypothetical protein